MMQEGATGKLINLGAMWKRAGSRLRAYIHTWGGQGRLGYLTGEFVELRTSAVISVVKKENLHGKMDSVLKSLCGI